MEIKNKNLWKGTILEKLLNPCCNFSEDVFLCNFFQTISVKDVRYYWDLTICKVWNTSRWLFLNTCIILCRKRERRLYLIASICFVKFYINVEVLLELLLKNWRLAWNVKWLVEHIQKESRRNTVRNNCKML